MGFRQTRRINAAILAGTAGLVVAAPARAECDCPSGSQWLAVGQSTTIDKCGLQVLLSDIQHTIVHGDQYVVHVKAKMIRSKPVSDESGGFVISQNHAISIAADSCGSLLIGAHRAPQKDLVELNWSYF